MNEQGKINVRHDWPVWLLLLGMVVTGFILWPSAPESMPVHWGINGQPDRFGTRFEGLFGIPLVTVGVYLLMVFLPRIDPGRANYRLFGPTYTAARVGVVAFLAVIYFLAQISIQTPSLDFTAMISAAIGLLFIILGNLLPKIRPSWFVGIRTPWTLTSKLAWNRTHRVGGWTMMLLGVLLLPMGFMKSAWAIVSMLVLIFVWVVYLSVYSYLMWKRDPERIHPANSQPAEEERVEPLDSDETP